MSGTTSIAGAGLPPVEATAESGVAVAATTHLRPVKYPNRLDDVAVVGRTGAWRRTFMLRPKYAGRFLFLLYPAQGVSAENVLSQAVHFPNFNSAPKVLEFRIPPEHRIHRAWNWRLIKTTFDDGEEGDFELRDSIARTGDGFLDGHPAARFRLPRTMPTRALRLRGGSVSRKSGTARYRASLPGPVTSPTNRRIANPVSIATATTS